MIRAVVLDGDGVLVDLPNTHFVALNLALERLGFPVISEEDHETKFNGLATKLKLQMLGIVDPQAVKAVYDLKQQLTLEMAGQLCVYNPILVWTLERLRVRGYKIAVASNAIRPTVDLMVQGTGIEGLLEFSLCNQDVSNPKPHPEIYSLACQKLGYLPQDVLAVEDSAHGQRAALEAGCRLCAVRDSKDVHLTHILESISEHDKL